MRSDTNFYDDDPTINNNTEQKYGALLTFKIKITHTTLSL